MDGDGSESVRGRVGMGVKSAGMGGTGLKSHPRAHLYFEPKTDL